VKEKIIRKNLLIAWQVFIVDVIVILIKYLAAAFQSDV
jgi:hypothetical protein